VDRILKSVVAIAVLAGIIAIVQPSTAVGADDDPRSLIVVSDGWSNGGPIVRQAGTVDESPFELQFSFGAIRDSVNLTLRLPDGQPFTPGSYHSFESPQGATQHIALVSTPQFAVCTDGRSTLIVEEASYSDGKLDRFIASFVIVCERLATTVITGVIGFDTAPASPGPRIISSPPEIDFGSQTGGSFAASTVVANFGGTAALISVDESNSGAFSVQDDCSGALAPASGCAVTIALGGRAESGRNAGSITIDAAGEAIVAEFSLGWIDVFLATSAPWRDGTTITIATSTAFERVRVTVFDDEAISFRGTRAGNDVRLRGEQGDRLTPGRYVVDDQTLEGPQLSGVLRVCQQSEFNVTEVEYDPNGQLTRLAATVSESCGSPSLIAVIGYNVGRGPAVADARYRNFGAGPTSSFTFIEWPVQNLGASPLIINGIGLVSDEREYFDLEHDCPNSLDPNERCTVTLSLSPFGTTTGRFDATVIVESNSYFGPIEFTWSALAPAEWKLGEPPPVRRTSGYWLLQEDGLVESFGDARHLGDTFAAGDALQLLPTPTGLGYWILSEEGFISAHGDALNLGQLGRIERNELLIGENPISMSSNPAADGYRVFTTHGRVYGYGEVADIGDLLEFDLAARITDSMATPTGAGAYMIGTDGGVFALGDARFAGSIPEILPGVELNEPIVGIVADPDGVGYWLVAADGGVFGFDAPFRGSIPQVLPGVTLNEPIVAMVPYGNGYLLVASDGGVFNFSDLAFSGSRAGNVLSAPVTSIGAVIPE